MILEQELITRIQKKEIDLITLEQKIQQLDVIQKEPISEQIKVADNELKNQYQDQLMKIRELSAVVDELKAVQETKIKSAIVEEQQNFLIRLQEVKLEQMQIMQSDYVPKDLYDKVQLEQSDILQRTK